MAACSHHLHESSALRVTSSVSLGTVSCRRAWCCHCATAHTTALAARRPMEPERTHTLNSGTGTVKVSRNDLPARATHAHRSAWFICWVLPGPQWTWAGRESVRHWPCTMHTAHCRTFEWPHNYQPSALGHSNSNHRTKAAHSSNVNSAQPKLGGWEGGRDTQQPTTPSAYITDHPRPHSVHWPRCSVLSPHVSCSLL